MIRFHIIFLLFIPFLAVRADEIDEPDPETAFYEGLAKLEAKYISSMRTRAEKAASIQIFRISHRFAMRDPFKAPEEGFEINLNGKTVIYPIIKAGNVTDNRSIIQKWAKAVLPEAQLPLTACAPTPGYAVWFRNDQGEITYRCTICLECHIASMEFPSYSGKIGVSVDTIRELLKLSGLESEIPKIEPTGASDGDKPSK